MEMQPKICGIWIDATAANMFVESYMMTNRNVRGEKLDRYHRAASNAISRISNFEDVATMVISELAGREYQPPEWATPVVDADATRFGYSTNWSMSKYHYVMYATHDLQKKVYELAPFKWENGYQERFSDMKTFTISDTCTIQELADLIQEAYKYIESYSPMSEKYRTPPKQRRKVIEKWRKEHSTDPRAIMDIESEKIKPWF